MHRIQFLTAGESHGEFLSGIIEGIPAGLPLSGDDFVKDSVRRRTGIGRSERMHKESDKVSILSGIRHGITTGAPISIQIRNEVYSEKEQIKKEDKFDTITVPRPGHADYAGYVKFGHTDIRDVIERASARETVIRSALGCIAKKFLSDLKLEVCSRVLSVYSVYFEYEAKYPIAADLTTGFVEIINEASVKYKTKEEILNSLKDTLISNGDSCGGSFQVLAHQVPVGLGTYTQRSLGIDSIIASAMMSIPSVKSVSFGSIDEKSDYTGRTFSDTFRTDSTLGCRNTNNAGGIEGGMTNGEPIIVNCKVKPIPTIKNFLVSIDLQTGLKQESFYENADIWVVESCGVIGESLLALELMDAILIKYGSDSMKQLKQTYRNQTNYESPS